MSLDQKLIVRCCHANFSRDVDKIEYANVASEPLMNFHTQFVKECRKIRGTLILRHSFTIFYKLSVEILILF